LKVDGIREALLDFHKKWYSSNIMTLAITGCHSIEQLEEWARDKFSPVVNKKVEVPNLGEPMLPFTSENLGQMVKFCPVKDKDKLEIYWVLPFTDHEWKSKPLLYFSHLFGHEGENSLLSHLKEEGLAMELVAGYD
jgi:insulysin